MGETKSFVYLEIDQYEELVSRSTQLAMIEKAYKELASSYKFDDFVNVLLGEPAPEDEHK